MSYLILGSCSFAGSTLIDHLLTKGERVVGINRSAEYHPILQPYYANYNKSQFDFYQLDININFAEISEVLKKYKPRYVIDLAGQGMVAESWQNPDQWYTTNIVAKVKLHEVLRNCDFLECYVRASTPEVYGSVLGEITEACHYNPSTPYAVSHAAIDMSLQAFQKQYEFPVIFTRFANFYGPSQQLYRIIPRTIIYALTGKKLSLHGGGHSERAFIYGYDVATGIEATIQKGTKGEAYHFSSGNSISIRQLVEKICQMLEVDFEDFVEIAEDRPGKDAKYEMDSQKAKESLQWAPAYTLEQGLQNTIEWVKNNLDIIQQLPLQYIHKS